MKSCGRQILAHVDEQDEGGVYAPIQIESNGKWEPGGVLTLQDRAIFAWITGTLRVKNFEQVVRYDAVTDVVDEGTEPPTRLNPEKVTFTVHSDHPVVFKVLKVEDHHNVPLYAQRNIDRRLEV